MPKIQLLKKLICYFYKKHLEKPVATSPPNNPALTMAGPTVKPTRPITKRKQGQPANLIFAPTLLEQNSYMSLELSSNNYININSKTTFRSMHFLINDGRIKRIASPPQKKAIDKNHVK